MVIKDRRSRSLPSFVFSTASLASSLLLFICVSLPPPAPYSVCAAAILTALILLSSPLCAGTPSNYLTTTLKQTNICLEAGPDPATAVLLRTHQPPPA